MDEEDMGLRKNIKEYEEQLSQKETEIIAKDELLRAIQQRCDRLEAQVDELNATNQMLKDEQKKFVEEIASLSEKYDTTQQQYEDLIEKWLERMNLDAEVQDKEIEKFKAKRRLEAEQKVLEASALPIMPEICCNNVTVPTKALCSFEAHEGEICDIKWSPSGRKFATAGADRKVKVWEVSANKQCQLKGALSGSNGGFISVDFDSEPENSILAGCNDYACHIWDIHSQRHKHALTGHTGKVFCAKYMENAEMVLSGSHDRTLKQWDLKERACVRTMFAGSSCNAVITLGSLVISGHFDKKLRFWDKRTESQSNEMTLQAKITSLDLAADRNRLLCSTREPSLKIVDIRMNQVVSTFTDECFNIGADYTKGTFSPNEEYVCCGSSNGSIYIWNVAKGKVEKVLEKEHHHTVTACSWHPGGTYLLSCDNKKRVVLWSDF